MMSVWSRIRVVRLRSELREAQEVMVRGVVMFLQFGCECVFGSARRKYPRRYGSLFVVADIGSPKWLLVPKSAPANHNGNIATL